MPPSDEKDNDTVFQLKRETQCQEHTEDDERPPDMKCGIGPIKFPFMQICARMGCFVGAYSVCALMTSMFSVYIVSQITAIEKQYGLSSSQSGFLLSCNDIGYLGTTLFASYFARKVHIPRTLWLCVVVYGFAGILCAMPFFISKDLVYAQAAQLSRQVAFSAMENATSITMSPVVRGKESATCNIRYNVSSHIDRMLLPNSTACEPERDTVTGFGVGNPNEYTTLAMAFIAIGMLVQGLTKAPRYPFITTYVDDNVKKRDTAMYMGIISGIGIVGPVIAFMAGAVFSRQYVTLQNVPISPRHPAWIGAWWLGFIIFGVISIFVSFTLICFPKRMSPRLPEQRPPASDTIKQSILGFVKCLRRLVCNPVYMPLVISKCFELFAAAGAISFSAKYLETQFYIPAWRANMLLGATYVIAAAIGSVVGGFVVSKRKLSPLACVKMLLILGFFLLIKISLGFVFGCSNENITGFNVKSDVTPGTNQSCSDMCSCDSSTYFPVCGSNGISYMSPCHAGCQVQVKTNYRDCICVGGNGTAVSGLCETKCGMLYPYLVTNVFGAFLSTLGMMPSLIIMIRSVREVDKSMAVGCSAFISTVCGWFAGPVLFGLLIDTACVTWSDSCSGRGACALYDNVDFRYKKFTFLLIPKTISVLLHLFVFFKARPKTDWTIDKPEPADKKEDTEAAKSMISEKE